MRVSTIVSGHCWASNASQRFPAGLNLLNRLILANPIASLSGPDPRPWEAAGPNSLRVARVCKLWHDALAAVSQRGAEIFWQVTNLSEFERARQEDTLSEQGRRRRKDWSA